MNNNNSSRAISISGATLGFITWLVFLILKVTKTWNISWFWVWFPLWIPWAIGFVLIMIAFVCGLLVTIIEKKKDR